MLPPDSQALLEHALLLLVRQHGGEPAVAERAAATLAKWRTQSPAHEAAAAQAERAWQATQASHLQGVIDAPLAARQVNRRLALRSVAALAVMGSGAWMGLCWWQQPTLRLSLRSLPGQMLTRTLPDGSVLDLAANSAVEVAYYRDRREVTLQHGEVRFDVAHQGQPFMVLSPWASVRVLGTSFSVAARADSATVRVATGRVAVWPGQMQEPVANPALQATPTPTPTQASALFTPDAQWQRRLLENVGAAVELGAGQAVTVRRGQLEAVQAIEASSVGAWRQGWLVFNDTSLLEAIANWNDYLRYPVEVAQQAQLQQLRLTGSYPLAEPSVFLASLPAILPVCVRRLANGRQMVSAKPACAVATR